MAAIDDARAYIDQAFGPTYSTWMALLPDDQNRTLVSATRFLNRLPWQGTPTGILDGNSTTLAWPRTGVFVDGVAIDSTTIPNDVVEASFELAVLIAADPSVVGKIDQGSNIQSVGGSGVPSVSFFTPTSARNGTAPVLPVVVQRLVGKYLATPGGSEGGFGQAGKCESAFSRHQQFNLVWPEE